jgi:hypothetical protein
LKIEELPLFPKYQNLEEFISNPDSVKPILSPGFEINKGGRPEVKIEEWPQSKYGLANVKKRSFK